MGPPIQETPDLGKPEILIGAPSSNNLEGYYLGCKCIELTTEPFFLTQFS